jgi:hypothetical protein
MQKPTAFMLRERDVIAQGDYILWPFERPVVITSSTFIGATVVDAVAACKGTAMNKARFFRPGSGQSPRDDLVLTLKGPDNPFGSYTGPYLTNGGWGTPAQSWDKCPKCCRRNFKYVAGFGDGATNECGDCGYSESFAY